MLTGPRPGSYGSEAVQLPTMAPGLLKGSWPFPLPILPSSLPSASLFDPGLSLAPRILLFPTFLPFLVSIFRHHNGRLCILARVP